MPQETKNIDKKRIAKNTLILYVRQIGVMGIQLYTVRAVLNILGVDDYGIFNVIAGCVTLLSFLTSTMSSATQRFFSFALGKKDFELLKAVFGTNVIVYIAIAVFAAVILESIGIWFINSKLNIPPGRFPAAQLLYQFVILRFIFSLVSAPCTAILIAHEDMDLYAWISIAEALLSLLIIIILPFGTVDKLPLYGFLMMLSSFIIAVTYIVVCSKKYTEFSVKNIKINKALLREIFDFTGWTVFGCLSCVLRSQAVTVLVNQFFNPAVVAARAIALNISGALNTFSSNFNTGLYPPLIKAWSAGAKEEMYHLVYWGSKMTFFLTWLFALPCFLEMDFILRFWLKNTPDEAVLFTRLILIESVILSVSLPLITAARAPGKMRDYELILGCIQILILPVSWLILILGGAAYSTLIVAIAANIVMFFARLLIVRNLTGLSIRTFAEKVLKPVLISSFVSLLFSCVVKFVLPSNILASLTVLFSSGCFTVAAVWFCGMNSDEKKMITSMLKNKLLQGNV